MIRPQSRDIKSIYCVPLYAVTVAGGQVSLAAGCTMERRASHSLAVKRSSTTIAKKFSYSPRFVFLKSINLAVAEGGAEPLRIWESTGLGFSVAIMIDVLPLLGSFDVCLVAKASSNVERHKVTAGQLPDRMPSAVTYIRSYVPAIVQCEQAATSDTITVL